MLAERPAPVPRRSDAAPLATQLQAIANRELANEVTESLEERTRAYGEMLVVCATCHLRRD